MPWLAEAIVRVSVVHGDEVDIAEYEASVVVLLQGLGVAHVEQFGPVKGLIPVLRDSSEGKAVFYLQYMDTLVHTSEQKHEAHLVHATHFVC